MNMVLTSSCPIGAGVSWKLVFPMLFLWVTWRYMMSIALFIFSSSTLTRRLTVNVGLKACKAWSYIRSFSLIRVTGSPPTVRVLIGRDGGLTDEKRTVIFKSPDVIPYDE